MWHELLLPFIGAKKLRFGSVLTLELSRVLNSVTGGLAQELLPELQELDVLPKYKFLKFIKTRNSVGRPVHLLTPLADIIHFWGANLDELWRRPRYQSIINTNYRIITYPRLPDSGTLSIDVEDIHKSLIMILKSVAVWRAPRADNVEQASPKKKRRTHENKRRLRENPQRRANENWRCRELRGSSRNNARISQPGGKKIAI
jgi:hypothetical protein